MGGFKEGEWDLKEIPNYYKDYNAIVTAEIEYGLHDRSNTALRVRWCSILRDIIAPRCPTNKVGSPLVSDIDIYQASCAERTEALAQTIEKTELLSKKNAP